MEGADQTLLRWSYRLIFESYPKLELDLRSSKLRNGPEDMIGYDREHGRMASVLDFLEEPVTWDYALQLQMRI